MRGVKPPAPSRPTAPPAGAADFDTLLDRGIELFNRQQFFEAHDVWEDAWRVSSGDRAIFLQGLIQIAAGYVKWQRGQPRGMAALLEKGAEKLVPLQPRFEGVELDGLLGSLAIWCGTAPQATERRADPACACDPPLIIRQR
jgi:hypothetical protein